MKKYFKEVRESLVSQYLNESEMVYSGYHNNDYIKKQLSSYLGQLVKNLNEYGVDTVIKDHDTSFSITLRTASNYIKAYKTQKSYCEAIEDIAFLFDKYDNKYIEVEDKEEDKEDSNYKKPIIGYKKLNIGYNYYVNDEGEEMILDTKDLKDDIKKLSTEDLFYNITDLYDKLKDNIEYLLNEFETVKEIILEEIKDREDEKNEM